MCNSISLDFSEESLFEEIRFHLKAIIFDLSVSIKTIEEASTENLNDPRKLEQLRYALEGLLATLDHVIFHHSIEVLKSANQLLDEPSLLEIASRLSTLKADWSSEILLTPITEQLNIATLLGASLQEFASSLRLALQEVSQIVQLTGTSSTWREYLKLGLIQFIEVISGRVRTHCQVVLSQVTQLYYLANPGAAVCEWEWETLATPLYEDSHPHARQLAACPRCGTVLTPEDRTFDGSYCESCRTRWVQSNPPSL